MEESLYTQTFRSCSGLFSMKSMYAIILDVEIRYYTLRSKNTLHIICCTLRKFFFLNH